MTVASALLVDYVLTVAVSISSGAQYAAGAIPALSRPRGDGRVGRWCVVLMAMNLRGIRESGTFFAFPTYAFMVAHPRDVRLRPAAPGRPATCRTSRAPTCTITPDPGVGEVDSLTTLGLLFLLARAFSSGCAALTGVEAISNGVPAFRKPKSQNAATTLLLLGDDRDHDDGQRHRAGQADGAAVRRPPPPRPADAATASRCPSGYDQNPVIAQIAQGGLQRLLAGLLLRGHGDRDHPGARRQHGVQRLPGARLDPGQGRLRSAGARLPRRPAGLQQRHRVPRRDGDHPDPGLRRRRPPG